MGEIIAVASQKGGVGKTTTTVNLGASLAIIGKKIMIIDLDPQGSISASFQLSESKTNIGLYQVFSQNIPLMDAIVDIGLGRLDIVPSNVNTEEEEVRQYRLALNFQFLRHVLVPYKEVYDYILIDCPPSLGTLTINALTAADSVLVPIQCEYYSLKSLGKFVRAIKNISAKYNNNLQFKGFLITMYDKRIRKSREIANELRYSFKQLVFESVIPRNSRVAEAPSKGKPVALFDISSSGAIAYLELAEEIINMNEKHS